MSYHCRPGPKQSRCGEKSGGNSSESRHVPRRGRHLGLPARVRDERDPVRLHERGHGRDRVAPAAAVVRRPDDDRRGRRSRRDQPVARRELRHVVRVEGEGDELHRL